jgi:hypothetical protein
MLINYGSEFSVHGFYNPATDRHDLWIVTRDQYGKITHIGELSMVPAGESRPPTLSLDTGSDLLTKLRRTIDLLLPPEKAVGNEWKGRYEAAARHLEDLRHLLNLKAVEKLDA